jgi:hypothetical protein
VELALEIIGGKWGVAFRDQKPEGRRKAVTMKRRNEI